MPKPGETGIKRVYRATIYSWQGLSATWRYESAFRQECMLALLLTPVAFWLAEDAIQLILLVGVMALVLVVELMNSAIEAVVDRISDEVHELAGRAKDQGSAAVFITLALAVFTWGAIMTENLTRQGS